MNSLAILNGINKIEHRDRSGGAVARGGSGIGHAVVVKLELHALKATSVNVVQLALVRTLPEKTVRYGIKEIGG